MKVLVLGATGLVGRALVLRLQREGHQVSAFVRSRARALSRVGADVALVSEDQGEGALARAVAEAEAVVNLAGEPLVGQRWTAARKQAFRQSRVELNHALVDAMRASLRRPTVLVSASAVGYYGDRGDERLDENSSSGSDFLAVLCRDWEAAAAPAEELGVRVVKLRFGVVLSDEGGALAKMLPPFRLGLGGRLGSGRQQLSWVHIDDVVEVITTSLSDPRYRGAFNLTSPEPVSNAELTRALGGVLGRPTVLPVPALALRLAFGQAATVLLDGQHALPARLLALGYHFHFPTLEGALDDLLRPSGACTFDLPGILPDSPYLLHHPPGYRLRCATLIDAPLDQVFAFFSRPQNLGLLTPLAMSFSITSAPERMTPGARIDYQLRVAGRGIAWTTRVERWEPPRVFVDLQERGPYASWWHEHRFEARGDQTLMSDLVLYRPPLGWLGRLANRLFVAPTLRRIFAHRGGAMRLRFGVSPLHREAA